MNARAYIVAFTASYAERQQVQDFLDTVPEVTFWYASLPYCVFVTSTLTANELSSRFNARFGTARGNYIIMEASANRQGWMPEAVWHLLSNPDAPRLKGG